MKTALFALTSIIGLFAFVPTHAQTRYPEAKHDLSPPLSTLKPLLPPPGQTIIPLRATVANPPPPVTPGPPSVSDAGLSTTVATTSKFIKPGVGQGDYGFSDTYAPPDTNGAVGATQYVQWVNVSFAVFSKTTGAKIYGPAAGNTLWTGFGGPCETDNNGDPIAQYDKQANRWVMTQFAINSAPYMQCVAVSTTSDATGTYNRYAFSYGNELPDYPKLGVWPDAYYITYNQFFNDSTFDGALTCAWDRAAMLAGQTASQVCFNLGTSVASILPADLDGATPPPTGAPNYQLTLAPPAGLNLYKFHVDFTTPANSTYTGPVNIPVFSYSEAPFSASVPQKGTTQMLNSLGDRLMYRFAYRNFGDHKSLMANHTIQATNNAGQAVFGIRWYEIRSPGTTPVVNKTNTYAPGTTPCTVGWPASPWTRKVTSRWATARRQPPPTRLSPIPVAFRLIAVRAWRRQRPSRPAREAKLTG